MTVEEVARAIERLAEENGEMWSMCGNVVDLPYYEGFNAACEKALDIIYGRENE